MKEIEESLAEMLVAVGWNEVPIIPINALSGDNILPYTAMEDTQPGPTTIASWYQGPSLIEALYSALLRK